MKTKDVYKALGLALLLGTVGFLAGTTAHQVINWVNGVMIGAIGLLAGMMIGLGE